MTVSVLITLAVLALAVGLFVFRAIPGIRAYFAYKGKRLITCPETRQPEAVDVAAERPPSARSSPSPHFA